MSLAASRRALALASAALLATTAACTGSEEPPDTARPVSPVSVELAPEGVPDAVSIGVVVSLSSAPDQGAQWSQAAAGAQVAAYRYGLGDVDVSVLARDDHGSGKGARQAVHSLADEGVSGIVLATEGSHVDRALVAAADRGLPVLLPYEGDAAQLPEGAWTTSPSDEQAGAALATALTTAGASRPLLVDAGGGPLPGVGTQEQVTLRPGGEVTAVAAQVARQTRGQDSADSVLVSGPAPLQGQLVQALQARNVTVPLFLSDDAVSPAFADSLARAGGSLASPLTTAGLDTDDVAALDSGTSGAAVSAYLAALRATAEDGDVTDFFGDELFETVAPVADVRSHDAVVALVSAAAAAGSAEPGDVQQALSGLTLDHGDGLAGPALDFGSSSAIPPESVVPLQATTQDPGLRPVSSAGTPRLYWFASPTD